jgi:phenylalanyl-tRNA synthetase alpha chain
MMIDKGLSIAHLKDLLTTLLSGVLESEVEVRLRPAFFPFVEP